MLRLVELSILYYPESKNLVIVSANYPAVIKRVEDVPDIHREVNAALDREKMTNPEH